MQEKIKNRINSLLAKTKDNGCTEAEAMAAITKAKQLMTDYFISESDLVDKEDCVLKSVPFTQGYWLFISSLAKTFDCQTYKHGKQIMFFGFESDVEMCIYFNDYIIRSCKAAIANYKRSSEYLTEKQIVSSKRLTGGFRNGFLSSISKKLNDMYMERKNTVKIGHGLVSIEKERQVSKEFRKLGLRLKTSARSYSAGGGFNTGKEKGSSFSVNKGVNNRSGVLALN